jgi:hypothetical protein
VLEELDELEEPEELELEEWLVDSPAPQAQSVTNKKNKNSRRTHICYSLAQEELLFFVDGKP